MGILNSTTVEHTPERGRKKGIQLTIATVSASGNTIKMKVLLTFASCLVFAVVTAEAKDNEVVSWIIDSSTNSEVDLIAEKLKKIKATPYVLFNAKNAKGIEMRSRLPHLQKWMKEKIKSEY